MPQILPTDGRSFSFGEFWPWRGCRKLGLAMTLLMTPQLLATGESARASSAYSVPGVEIGGFVTEDGAAGEVNVITPLHLESGRSLLFFGFDGEFRGAENAAFDDALFNIGAYLGYRIRVDDAVVGFWGGFDYLNTPMSNTYTRFIAGAEYFGTNVIARFNGFIPLDESSGGSSTLEESITSGIDGEVGLRYEFGGDLSSRPAEFRAFIGGYDYFGLNSDGSDVAGVKGRLELDLYPFASAPNTRLTLNVAASYDEYNGSEASAGVRVAIPLGAEEPAGAYYEGSIKDGAGSLKDTGGSLKDDPVASDAFSSNKDLFQPVRRNRKVASRTEVCNGPLSINWGSLLGVATTTTLGATIGVPSDFSATGAPLTLDLASMTDAGGQTLAQLLAASPTSLTTTLFLQPVAPFFTFQLDPGFTGTVDTIYASSIAVEITPAGCSVYFPSVSVFTIQ